MMQQLFQLQEIDNALARIAREKARLDDGSVLRSERDTLNRALQAEQARLVEVTTGRRDLELQLKSTEEKVARQQDRLMKATSAHEVTSLQRDINGLNHARGELDEKILMLMDEAEGLTTRIADLEAQLKDKQESTRATEENFHQEVQRLDGEAVDFRGQREKLVAEIVEPAMNMYKSLAAKHGGVAVVANVGGNCSACGMQFTPYNLREAKSKEYPTCENCNRLLWLG